MWEIPQHILDGIDYDYGDFTKHFATIFSSETENGCTKGCVYLPELNPKPYKGDKHRCWAFKNDNYFYKGKVEMSSIFTQDVIQKLPLSALTIINKLVSKRVV